MHDINGNAWERGRGQTCDYFPKVTLVGVANPACTPPRFPEPKSSILCCCTYHAASSHEEDLWL